MPKLILHFEDRVLKEYAAGQRVTIGRLPDNTVVIAESVVTEDAKPAVPNIVGTMYLNTAKHRELLARLRAERKQAAAALSTATSGEAAEATVKGGVLRVLDGRTDQAEYTLEARTSFIGKSDTALVRLNGLFRPKVAMAIVRNGDEYVATPLAGRTQINSHSISGRYILKDGDVLQVCGLRLEFRLKG